jgi:hypothetical protein
LPMECICKIYIILIISCCISKQHWPVGLVRKICHLSLEVGN